MWGHPSTPWNNSLPDTIKHVAEAEPSVASFYFLIKHTVFPLNSHPSIIIFVITRLRNLGSCHDLTMLKSVQILAKRWWLVVLKRLQPFLVSAQYLVWKQGPESQHMGSTATKTVQTSFLAIQSFHREKRTCISFLQHTVRSWWKYFMMEIYLVYSSEHVWLQEMPYMNNCLPDKEYKTTKSIIYIAKRIPVYIYIYICSNYHLFCTKHSMNPCNTSAM